MSGLSLVIQFCYQLVGSGSACGEHLVINISDDE